MANVLIVTAHAKLSHLSANFTTSYEPQQQCTDIFFEIEFPPRNDSLGPILSNASGLNVTYAAKMNLFRYFIAQVYESSF